MKHISRPLFMIPVFLGVTASAQITIGPADMPSAGDTVRYRNTITTADMADTGPSHLWDFSALVPNAEAADTMVTVGSTPILYQFFFNNSFVYPENKADFAMRGPSIGIQGFSISNVFNYFKSNSAGYRDVGFGANVNGLPTSVQRTPVDWIYRFPLNFGDQDSSASHYQVSVPALGFYGQDQMRRNEVDGWGTLILPADTFEVLRVKSRIERTDTVYIEQFNIGFAIPEPETIEYKWIAQGMDEPVLQVTSVGGVNTVVRFFYQPDDITTGIAPGNGSDPLRAWPNPASTVLHLEGASLGTLELVGADGSVVRTLPQSSRTTRTVDVSSLTPGLYTLRSNVDGTTTHVVIAR
ncbi:MAG: T9SS type A sorting domain-containing protein [Flavobacteriales bacterium]|nr:T9SS type A sorting domain-containing protein [Flavobacteriales bacterium]MBK7288288.1 T9SS type A sorting domain-containing protein [Flavobacteriales bacterium]MBK9060454.1 T9SS type A sorting domain-containing protein [Flavobacteriales bacterium]MBK9597078.1 T9SS type A sorting domain-containing protein [Flavobacteriales bacterium]HQV39948.1 hypothetical protein [Flavobacteriales bacterium]